VSLAHPTLERELASFLEEVGVEVVLIPAAILAELEEEIDLVLSRLFLVVEEERRQRIDVLGVAAVGPL